jgi:AcrR family transcriptional regulator
MADHSSLRRTPQQQRRQQQVNHILDSAASVFQEVGYESATVSLIAMRSEMSISSLYQFFPNKEALRDGLITRYTTGVRGLMTLNESLPWPTLVHDMLERVMRYGSEHDGFYELFINANLAWALEAQMADYVAHLIRTKAPQLPPVKVHNMAVISVAAMKGILRLAERSNAAEVLRRETVALLTGYLENALDDRA